MCLDYAPAFPVLPSVIQCRVGERPVTRHPSTLPGKDRMMRQTVPFRVSSGGQVLVEVAEDGSVTRTGTSPGEALSQAAGSISKALAEVRDAADDAVRTLSTMAARPAKIELAFGVKITGEASAIIAKVGGEAQFHVTVVWERPHGDAS
jgi:hypothetical protein